jgi:hypothetical protein
MREAISSSPRTMPPVMKILANSREGFMKAQAPVKSTLEIYGFFKYLEIENIVKRIYA